MKPKLRPLDVIPIEHKGQPMVLLRDPLRLGGGDEASIALPRALAPLLGLMDGSRDEAVLESALLLRSGVRLAPGLLTQLLADLDTACLLDNQRSAAAMVGAIKAFREAPFRPLTLDGESFSAVPEQTQAQLQGYVNAVTPAASSAAPGLTDTDRACPVPPAVLGAGQESDALIESRRSGAGQLHKPIRGVISPHIDYQRGGPVYAQVWQAAAQAACAADLVILLGTDHQGGDGTLTLTHQSYSTPWGVLPTDRQMVDALAQVLGPEAAFAEELNHRSEHSIELAAVWLHFVRRRKPVALVPILCGSFAAFVAGEGDPALHEPFAVTLQTLRQTIADRRLQPLVVAAADLAHMGPAFGDPYGLDFVGRARARNADERLLTSICAGDAAAFFDQLKGEGDRRHVCGLPPIYLALRLLQGASGERAGYALCPADTHGLSFVSIAGVILR